MTVLDFEGFVDGEAFEGGKGTDYPLTLGSGSFIPGFEDQDGIGVLLYFKKQFLVRRYLDDFDYVSFLNGK